MATAAIPNFKLPIPTEQADTFQRDTRNALDALSKSTGLTGATGPIGPMGPAGTNGTNGTNGATGPAGPAPAGTGFVHVTGGALDTPAELTGDITAGASGVATIPNNTVTYAKMADLIGAGFTGGLGAGDPVTLTSTQATTLINTVTSTLKGSAPASGGGTANYLRADGTWAIPAGTGVTGTGTINTVAKWTSTTAIGNSTAITDDGTFIVLTHGVGGEVRVEDELRVNGLIRSPKVTNTGDATFESTAGVANLLGKTVLVAATGAAGNVAITAAGTGTIVATGPTTVTGMLAVTGLVTATAGVTTPANLTTTGTGALVVAGATTIGGVLDVDNDLAKFGSVLGDGTAYIYQGTFNAGYALNSAASLYINAVGYQAGTTQFRNLYVQDGKSVAVATFTGSTKEVTLAGALTVANGLTVTAGTVTLPAGQIDLVEMANLAADTIIGRANGAGTGVPTALTAAQVNTILPVATATVKGLVPTPPNNTTTFLRGDATFATPAGDSRVLTALLGTDYNNATATATKVTGLDKTLAAGTYQFAYTVVLQTATTGTGFKSSLNFSGTQTILVANHRTNAFSNLGTSTATQSVAPGLTAALINATQRAASTAGIMIVSAVDTANADVLLFVEGTIKVTVSGDIQLYMASEDTNNLLVKTGSSLVITQVT